MQRDEVFFVIACLFNRVKETLKELETSQLGLQLGMYMARSIPLDSINQEYCFISITYIF